MGTPHKHADLIKAWADGAEIEVKCDGLNAHWVSTSSPEWSLMNEYRIKPEEPKLVARWLFAVRMKGSQLGSAWSLSNLHTDESVMEAFAGHGYDIIKLEHTRVDLPE